MNRLETKDEKFFESILARSLTSDSEERMAFFSVPENDREDEFRYEDSPYVSNREDRSDILFEKVEKKLFDEQADSKIAIHVSKEPADIPEIPEIPIQKVFTENLEADFSSPLERKKKTCDVFSGAKKPFFDGVRICRGAPVPRYRETQRKDAVLNGGMSSDDFFLVGHRESAGSMFSERDGEKCFSEKRKENFAVSPRTNSFKKELLRADLTPEIPIPQTKSSEIFSERSKDVFFYDRSASLFAEEPKPFSLKEEKKELKNDSEREPVFISEEISKPSFFQEDSWNAEKISIPAVNGRAKSSYGDFFQDRRFSLVSRFGLDKSAKSKKDNHAENVRREKKRKFFCTLFSCGRDFFSAKNLRFSLKSAYAFAGIGSVFLFGVGFVSYVVRGFSLEGSVLGVSARGMQTVSEAIGDLKRREFVSSNEKFELAARTFSEASKDVSSWAGILSNINTSLPFLSKLSSGKSALEAGEHLSLAGKNMATLAEIVSQEELRGSLLEMFRKGLTLSEQTESELNLAQQALLRVRVSDLPTDKQSSFLTLKMILPDMLAGLGVIRSNAPAFLDVLGGNGPRKYLFLFQNNQEARATGGFIGSYGLLDIKDGEIRKFFINGIFDPDGQLKESIVPPQPIRKISAAWSLHDSNWFADFPTSAEKAIFFYEKTGGPTVDGVVTMTPTVLQRILRETGPVFLAEYDMTIDAENVIPLLQYKVEKDYDKEENKPKKILSDLAPIIFERILHAKDTSTSLGVIQALHTSLREKDILLYSRNDALEKMYREMGWSGELRETQRDFVSVVNSNINGFKTDGVIEQTVRHHADIGFDGSVIDTVTITRKHTGGDTPYEWWNAVNADYMRLYVPKGSTLLSVRGQTREIIRDPLDYDALGFSRDALVSQTEGSMSVDSDSGTQIFEESGKTVFGNWVYVSPKESVTVEYTYRLPFSVFIDEKAQTAIYALLAQKQSGSVPGKIISDISYPKEWKTSWRSFEENSDSGIAYDGPFLTDLFFGYVFE